MQYSEKLEGQLLKMLFYICLNLSVYLLCYMHSKHAQTDVKSLEFTVTRVLMKILKTNSKDIVIKCKRYLASGTLTN